MLFSRYVSVVDRFGYSCPNHTGRPPPPPPPNWLGWNMSLERRGNKQKEEPYLVIATTNQGVVVG